MVETVGIAQGDFPYTPSTCPSTHGCAGYCIGDFITADGNVVCCLCGSITTYRKEADFGLPKMKVRDVELLSKET